MVYLRKKSPQFVWGTGTKTPFSASALYIRPTSKLLFSRMTKVSDELSSDMLLFHALNYKRSNQWDEALPLFEQLLESGEAELREVYRAHVELAKYHEHTTADFERALLHTEQAFEHCPNGDRHINGLKRRRLRIKKKASKQV